MPGLDTTTYVVLSLIAIFFAIGIHEYAHAKVADASGDPTPRTYGRVTLNLFKHFDPLGAIFIIFTTLAGFGIGWGKPVPMNPSRMKNPKWDHFWAVAAGPLSNLLQASIFALVGRVLLMADIPSSNLILIFCILASLINCGLFLFNLLPIGPLDGMWILGTFMPDPIRLQWTRWNLTTGQFVFLGLVLIGQMNPSLSIFGHVIRPLMSALSRVLWGVSI